VGKMSFGKGKYDEACTVLRKQTQANMALAIIVDGHSGNGFSIQTNNLDMLFAIPSLLRVLANSIEEDVKNKDEIDE
jgi:hypothetical protein